MLIFKFIYNLGDSLSHFVLWTDSYIHQLFFEPDNHR